MKKLPVLLVAMGVGMFGLAACGGDDDDGDGDTAAVQTDTVSKPAEGEAIPLKVSAPADGSLSFDQRFLGARYGNVKIIFNNPSSVSHDVRVKDSAGNEVGGTDLVSQGTAEVTLELTGNSTYTFYCDVPGHEEAGMTGPLTIG